MNAQYRKNLKAVLEASKTYCDESIDNLKWELGTYDLSVDTNTNTAHIKQLPSGAIQTTVAKVEGVGYKVNQLVANGNFATSYGWTFFSATSTLSISNNEATVTSGGTACSLYRTLGTTIPSGHKVLMICQAKSSDITGAIGLNIRGDTTSYEAVGSLTSSYSSFGAILTTDNTNAIEFYKTASSGSITYRNVNFFDLTADFGSGNEPTSVSDCATAYLQRGINIYEYTPQQSSIKNNAFTGATVEGTNKYDYGTSVSDYTTPIYMGVFDSVGNNFLKLRGIEGGGTILYRNRKMYKNGNFSISFKNVATTGFSKSRVYLQCYDIKGNILKNTDITISGFNYNNFYLGFFAELDINTKVSMNFIIPNNVYYWLIGFGGSTSTPSSDTITFSDIMLNEGLTALDYIPYTSQTISVDLTTIKDSNNVSLFPSGKMMGNSSVADFITPYNQESRYNQVDLSQCNWSAGNYGSNTGWYTDSITDIKTVAYSEKFNGTCEKYEIAGSKGVNLVVGVIMIAYGTSRVWVGRADGDTTNRPTGILQYERATYLTSNTDLTSLTKINAQSNGTITLNNTDNVDMPNTIKSLKEVAK